MGQHLSANDVLPPLKWGVGAPEARGTGEDLVTVGPMRMHGFELSIARMLDGRRTAKEIVESSKALGLPLSLDALEDFVFQLRTHGLIGDAFKAQRRREAWEPTARDLYRDALKAAREGEFDDARAYLDALLKLQPGTREAIHLKEWLQRHPDPHVAGRTFGHVFRQTLDGWAEERPPHLAAELRDTLRGSWWLPLGILTAIGFLIAYTMLPGSQRIFAAASFAPVDQVPLSAPMSATVEKVFVAAGDRVDVGAPLVAFDTRELQRRHAELTGYLRTLRAPQRAAVAQTEEGAALAETLARAEEEQARAQALLLREQAEGSGAAPAEHAEGAERQLAMANEAVERAQAALDALIPVDAAASGEAARVAEHVRALAKRLDASTVVAPAAGVVTQLGVEPGEAVKPGEPLLQLEQRGHMKVEVTLPGRRAASVAVGTPVTIHVGRRGYSTTVAAVDGAKIVAEVSNPDLLLTPGPMGVQVDLPPSGVLHRAGR